MNNKNFDISVYMKQAGRYHILSREEEVELAKAVQNGDKEAAQKFACHNLRFVVSIAHRYKTYCKGRMGINFEDVVQAGNEGLLRAVQKFDHTKGFKFVSYAGWWIKAYIQKYVFNNWSISRIRSTNARRVLFFRQKEISELGLIPREERAKAKEELALKLKVKVFEINYMIKLLSGREVGWDTPFECRYNAAGDSNTIANFIPVAPEQENIILDNEQKRLVRKAMVSLTSRERYILTQRFFDKLTFREIGEKLVPKISRERVRQIEQEAFKRMRKNLESIGVSKAYI